LSTIRSEQFAEALFTNLESLLGPRVFDAIIEKISYEYLGDELGLGTAIIERPDLFERAFIGIFGEEIGQEILAKTCERTKHELGLDKEAEYNEITYSVKGDFAKFVVTAMGLQTGTIMIVDDDDDILTSIAGSLKTCGYGKIQTFNDPIKALEHFRASKEGRSDYVLILLDFKMPHMDGLQLAKELLRLKADAKIVLMTAFELDEELRARLQIVTLEEGFLQKPFGKKELCVAVRNAICSP